VVRVEVGRTGGPEAAARTARYAALQAAAEAEGDDAIVLLGHTRDDQAESVLLGLARGSGLRSIGGMSPAAGIYRRPFLDVGRADTEAACRALGLQVWHDPHNADPAFTRVRVRTRVIPTLERELGPGITEALARTAALARADADALDQIAAQLRAESAGTDGSLDLSVLLGTHPALLSRVLRQAALQAGSPPGELFAVHVAQLLRLVTEWRGQQGVDLPGHLRARREHGRLHFEHRQPG
jgi:tRNA(Ile)-lysidine synthase